MKKVFLLFLFISLSLTIFAGNKTGNVEGYINDDRNGTPISGASVTSGSRISITDENGFFKLEDVAEGDCTLAFLKENYTPGAKTVKIVAMQTITINFSMKLGEGKLPEIVVKADRSMSATSSQVLNALDFQLRPINSAQDMLRNVPGLVTAQHAGGGKAEQLFIRGFDCDHGTDIAGFVDGVPVNMPSHGHGQGYMDFHFLIPEVVKNVEIYKGTYFADLGDFATGGAVKFKTKDVLDYNTLQTELTTVPTNRAFTSTRSLLMYQLLNTDKVSSYVAADFLYAPSYFQYDQHFNRFNLFSKTTFKLDENNTLRLLLTHFNSIWDANGQIPERAIESGLISRFGSIDNSEGGHTGRQNASLTFTNVTGNKAFEAQAYAFKYKFSLYSDFTFYRDDSIHGDEINQQDDRTVVGANLKYSISTSSTDKWSIGAGMRNDNIENANYHVQRRAYLNTIAHSLITENNTFFYLRKEGNLTSRLKYDVGLRFNYLNFNDTDLLPSDSTRQNYTGKNYQMQLAPKLNLIYTATDNLKLFLNAGRGFHSNDARAVVQDTSHTLPSAWSGEIGTQWSPIRNVYFSAAFWGMTLDNELFYNGDDGSTVNNGASRRIGVDLSARAQLTKQLYLDADLNLSQGRLVETPFGKPVLDHYFIALAPPATSTGGLSYRSEHWEGAFRYRYVSPRSANDDNSIRARGYFINDANIYYKTKKFRVGVNVENLFNVNWNEAQFATNSQLRGETDPVNELNFTAGTPLSIKLIVGFRF